MNHLGLFSGIGGFEEAFRRAGANLIGVCEIEPSVQRVLRRHFPNVRLINDVKEIKKDTFGGTPIDLITGGFPCQDLSVAGQRKGLDGERSGLWLEYLRIIADHQPGWVVIENVPGLLSSYSGDDPPSDLQEGEEWEVVEESDFAIILRGLVELGYGVAWRILDSEYDGVAQRRERVFIVGHLGEVRGWPFQNSGGISSLPAEVLFERDSGAWDSPPSREAGQGIANTVTTGTGKSCGPRNGHGHPLNLVAGTLSARGSAGGGLGTDFECDGGLQVFGLIGNAECAERPATLRADGGDCSGGSEHLIAGAVSSKWAKGTGGPAGDGCYNLVAVPQSTATLTSNGDAHSGFRCGDGLAVTAYPIQEVGKRTGTSTDDPRCGIGIGEAGEPMYSLQAGACHGVGGQFGVRRLTPRECERLQGFADDWTRWGDDGREISDSARYRMLGNAVCLPTVEWIARRILALCVLLFFAIPTFAAPYTRPRCTEPPTATPCVNQDGTVRRHTVEEWKRIEAARPKKLNPAEQRASVKGVEGLGLTPRQVLSTIGAVILLVWAWRLMGKANS